MALVSSSPRIAEPVTYRLNAHSKSPIAPFTRSCAFFGKYTREASSWPGFSCFSVVISVHAAIASASTAAHTRYFRMLEHQVDCHDEAPQWRNDPLIARACRRRRIDLIDLGI